VAKGVRIKWHGDKVAADLRAGMERRLTLAAAHLRNSVVKNISVPVGKAKIRGRVRVTDRSLPGEYPRADTSRLLRDIFFQVEGGAETRGAEAATVKRAVGAGKRIVRAIVGTTLRYGAVHELGVRPFLIRTWLEQRKLIHRIMTVQRSGDGPLFDTTSRGRR
jgi:hypothetical protein